MNSAASQDSPRSAPNRQHLKSDVALDTGPIGRRSGGTVENQKPVTWAFPQFSRDSYVQSDNFSLDSQGVGRSENIAGPPVDGVNGHMKVWPLRRPRSQSSRDSDVQNESAAASPIGSVTESMLVWPLRRPLSKHLPNASPALGREWDTHEAIPSEGVCSEGALTNFQRAMHSSSDAHSITKEPSWIGALKADIQFMLRKELSEIYARCIGPAVKRDMKTVLEKELSALRFQISQRQPDVDAPYAEDGDGKVGGQKQICGSLEVVCEEAEMYASHASDETLQGHDSLHSIRSVCDEILREIRGLQTTLSDECSLVTKSLGRLEEIESPVSARKQESSEATGSKGRESLEKVDLPIACVSTASHDAALHKMPSDRRHKRGRHRSWERETSGSGKGEESAENLKTTVLSKNTKKAFHSCSDLYKEVGFAQSVVRHQHFEHVCVAVIILNLIWMTIDIDSGNSNSITDANLGHVLIDVLFYVYFAGELLIRFLAFKHKRACGKDRWFLFDSAIVALYTLDPFVIGLVQYASRVKDGDGLRLPTGSLRLIRLARLTRLTRFLRAFPEMLIMMKGIATTLGAVCYILALLGLVSYVFAIALRSVVPVDSRIERECFPSIPESIHHLIIHGIFADSLAEFVLLIQKESVVCLILFWLYIAVSALLLMTMLVGVVCEVMVKVANVEREAIMVYKINKRFQKLLCGVDDDQKGAVTWEQISILLQTNDCLQSLMTFDVDVETLVDMLEDIFFNSSEHGNVVFVTYRKVIELILDLRGSKTASVKDVMAVGKRINARFYQLEEWLEELQYETHRGFSRQSNA